MKRNKLVIKLRNVKYLLKVTIEKKRRTQNFNFQRLKSSSLSCTHADII